MKDKIGQIHEGMDVQTADGLSLGAIKQIWWGSIPDDQFVAVDDETCFEVQPQQLLSAGMVYVPCSAVADVADGCITLSLDADAVAAKTWYEKPKWLTSTADVTVNPAAVSNSGVH
jgi:hypothetical protein